MKYLWTTIQVSNLEESIDFYSKALGLEVTNRFPAGPGSEIAFVSDEKSGTNIELFFSGKDLGKNHAGDVSMGFLCDDLSKKRSMLEELGYTLSPDMEPNPHIKFFFLSDPDGYKIQIAEQK